MKDFVLLMALFLIVFGFKSMAAEGVDQSISIQIEGSLIVQDQPGKPFKMEIASDEGVIALDNVHSSFSEGCTFGTYILQEDLKEKSFKLVDMVECLDDLVPATKIGEQLICPEIWMPVCGNFDQKEVTFGNICELKGAKASFISMGECL